MKISHFKENFLSSLFQVYFKLISELLVVFFVSFSFIFKNFEILRKVAAILFLFVPCFQFVTLNS